MITPYKGRDPYACARVMVHRNLHNGMWVITPLDGPHKGRTAGYTDAVTLTGCTFRIRAAAQRRIAAGANREVHAWVIGTMAPGTVARCDADTAITYRPHVAPCFVYKASGDALDSAPAVAFTASGGVYAGTYVDA